MAKRTRVTFTTKAGKRISFLADTETIERHKKGKRKLSVYNRFVREYMEAHPPKSLADGKRQMRAAARAWAQQ